MSSEKEGKKSSTKGEKREVGAGVGTIEAAFTTGATHTHTDTRTHGHTRNQVDTAAETPELHPGAACICREATRRLGCEWKGKHPSRGTGKPRTRCSSAKGKGNLKSDEIV